MPEIQVNALDGSFFKAYAAFPSGNVGPGIILVHGMGGLDVHMRALCDDLADSGYIVICPDLFERQKKGAVAQDLSEQENVLALSLYKNFDVSAGLRDIFAALATLRQTHGCNGKIGILGFCLGGRLAFLSAARSDVNCAVGYDNVGIEDLLNDVSDISVPLLLHFGEENLLMPEATRKKILSRLENNKKIQFQLYPSAGHAFTEKKGCKYNPESAKIAQEKTKSFLATHLKG